MNTRKLEVDEKVLITENLRDICLREGWDFHKHMVNKVTPIIRVNLALKYMCTGKIVPAVSVQGTHYVIPTECLIVKGSLVYDNARRTLCIVITIGKKYALIANCKSGMRSLRLNEKLKLIKNYIK